MYPTYTVFFGGWNCKGSNSTNYPYRLDTSSQPKGNEEQSCECTCLFTKKAYFGTASFQTTTMFDVDNEDVENDSKTDDDDEEDEHHQCCLHRLYYTTYI